MSKNSKLDIIGAINDEECFSIFPHGFRSNAYSDASTYLPEPRHQDAIFSAQSVLNSSIGKPVDNGALKRKHADVNSSEVEPLYKILKSGDRVLATVDLPLYLHEGYGNSRRTSGTVFATIKSVIHSGFSSAKYDIVLDQAPEGNIRHKNKYTNSNILTVSWTCIQLIGSSSKSSSMASDTQPKRTFTASNSSSIPLPPLPPPPPPSTGTSIITSKEDLCPPTASNVTIPITLSSGSDTGMTSSSVLNPKLFEGRSKGGWKSKATKY